MQEIGQILYAERDLSMAGCMKPCTSTTYNPYIEQFTSLSQSHRNVYVLYDATDVDHENEVGLL